ncbi:response regulator [Litoribacillus peritrichatus]|uniref:Response regulator n=1 Tax=Litoribacillus peritrichatus TaxID=718191 RepID=A0ABP7NAY4_9GAMM
MVTKPVRLLLVEDNPADVDLILDALTNATVRSRVEVANDGEQALAWLNAVETLPDLIFLDLNLPKMGGLDVLQKLKQTSRFKRVPVVVLTSSQADQDVLKSYDLGANTYTCKPLNLNDYRQVIRIIEAFWFGVAQLPPDQK